MKRLIIAILIGLLLGQLFYWYQAGRFSLWPCVHIAGEWRKVPLWPCPEKYPDCCGSSFTWMVLPPSSTPSISINEDGQVNKDGKPLEKMNDPEIKEVMKLVLHTLEEINQSYNRDKQVFTDDLNECLRINKELLTILKGESKNLKFL